MNKRILTILPTLALSLSLAACGGSDTSEGAAGDSGDTGSSSNSAQPSTDASEDAPEPTEEPAEDGPSAEDYANLANTLFEKAPDSKVTNAKEYNAEVGFPAGIAVETFEPETQTICIADSNTGATVRVVASGGTSVDLLEGACADDDVVSTLSENPDNPDAINVEGDKEIGDAVVDVFTERFGS